MKPRALHPIILVLCTSCLPGAEPTPVARARTILQEGAADRDTATRVEVAVALSLIAARDPSTALLEQLARDKDDLVRAAALGSIGELRDSRFAKIAREALKDEVPEVVFAAARTLFRMKQPEGKQVLVEIVEKESQAESGFLRAKLRDTWRRMKTPKSALLLAVQQGAGFLPVPGLGEGVSAMSSMLGDPDFSARATSLVMLASDRSEQIRRLIEQAFLDGDWSMRAAAVQITAMRGDRTLRPRLVPMLDDSHRKVRFRAAACMLRLNRVSSPAAAKR